PRQAGRLWPRAPAAHGVLPRRRRGAVARSDRMAGCAPLIAGPGDGCASTAGADGKLRAKAIADNYRRWGALRTAHFYLMRMLRKRITLCAVYVRQHRQDPVLPALAQGREVRIASKEELVAASRDPVYELTPGFIE